MSHLEKADYIDNLEDMNLEVVYWRNKTVRSKQSIETLRRIDLSTKKTEYCFVRKTAT